LLQRGNIAGQRGDGTPLSAVRVGFLEEWMAVSERRPLLGARTNSRDRAAPLDLGSS
jgi:hypothetical protein